MLAQFQIDRATEGWNFSSRQTNLPSNRFRADFESELSYPEFRVPSDGTGQEGLPIDKDGGQCKNLISIPTLFQTKEVGGFSVRTLQEWEGLVRGIEGGVIHAILRDLTVEDGTEERAEIPLTEIDPDQMERVKIGALFNIIIGYFNRGNGQQRSTIIYFRNIEPKLENDAHALAKLISEMRAETKDIPR